MRGDRRILQALAAFSLATAGALDLLCHGASRDAPAVAATEKPESAAPPTAPAMAAPFHPSSRADAEPQATVVSVSTPGGFAIGDRIGSPPRRAARPVPRERLVGRVLDVLRRDTPPSVTTSVVVRSLDSGETLMERHAEAARAPASNTKLLTTAAALLLLGPDFCFRTRLVAPSPPDGKGRVAGDLVVLGDGDPDEPDTGRPPLVRRIARELGRLGVRSVTGDVIVDDRVFDREFVHPTWNRNDLDEAFAAPVCGFSFHGNRFAVEVVPASEPGRPAAVSVLPAEAPFDLDARVETRSSGRHLVDVRPSRPGPGTLVVRGRTRVGLRPEPIELAVGDPLAVACAALERALRAEGVAVGGRVRPVTQGEETSRGVELAVLETPLPELLPRLNKDSNNVVAEHVFKRAGAALAGRGSFASGAAAVAEALRRLGVPARGGASVDGSGLSHENRWCAATLVDLVGALHASPYREAFEGSLAVGGVDGTLARRFRTPRLMGRVLAKSGFIRGTSALTGITRTDEGEWMAFSILMVGLRPGTNSAMKRVQEKIVALVADLGAQR